MESGFLSVIGCFMFSDNILLSPYDPKAKGILSKNRQKADSRMRVQLTLPKEGVCVKPNLGYRSRKHCQFYPGLGDCGRISYNTKLTTAIRPASDYNGI
jgi:hypothetical protein